MAQVFSVISCLMTLIFVLRLNLKAGIPDIYFVLVTGLVFDSAILGFTLLPLGVLMTKITPPHIEATVYAFLTSMRNVNATFGGLEGAWIAKWFRIGRTNLLDLWKLYLLQIFISLLPIILVIYLIPYKKEVFKL